jgi:short-subunit dehydrogenase
MARELRGRRILITGASGGIGRNLAEQLAGAGVRLALAARSQPALDELAGKLRQTGVEAHAIAADITNDADRKRLVDVAVDRLGGLDVLVNNAGIAAWGHFATSSEEVMRQIMEVNFFAPVELIRQALPVLERGQQPAVVNVASMCGRRGMPAWPEYSASKFALCGMSEALRGELVRFGIDLLLIVPGLTKTDLQKKMLRNEGKAKIEYDKGMPPEQVAARIVQAIRSGGFETVVGSDAKWMLRFNRLFPRLLDWLIGRRIRKLYASQS